MADTVVAKDSPVPNLDELKKIFTISSGGRFKYKSSCETGNIGERNSSVKGYGLEFEHVRPYELGDDVRHINWRVTAKSNQVHVKVFTVATDRPVTLIVESSANMRFATRGEFKVILAAKLMAMLAGVTFKHGDRLGACVFGDVAGGYYFSGINSKLSGIWQVFKAICSPITNIKQDIGLDTVLNNIGAKLPRGTLVFIICDVWSLSNDLQVKLKELSSRATVVLLPIADPMDCCLPQVPALKLRDATGIRHEVIFTKELRDAYLRQWQQHKTQLVSMASRIGSQLLILETLQDPQEILRELLAKL